MATLPAKREIEAGGCVIGMIHNLGQRKVTLQPRDLSFQRRVWSLRPFAHPLIEETEGLLLLNPGSATDRRRQPACTVAILI